MEPDQVSLGVQHRHLSNRGGPKEVEHFRRAGGLIHRHKVATHRGLQAVAVERLAGEQGAANIAVGDCAYHAPGRVADERDPATTLINSPKPLQQCAVRANDHLGEALVQEIFHCRGPGMPMPRGRPCVPDPTPRPPTAPMPPNAPAPTVQWPRMKAPSPTK